MTTESPEHQVESAWSELEDRLTDWLADVPPDGHVIIELAWPDDADESGSAPYVQVGDRQPGHPLGGGEQRLPGGPLPARQPCQRAHLPDV